MIRILVINPGSTSTKIAVYENEEQLWMENIPHDTDELARYPGINEQLPMRQRLLAQSLAAHAMTARSFDAVAARGGLLCPLEAGAYLVNEPMLHMLREHPRDQHASNLAAPLAYAVAEEAGIPAYIYDGVTVDEMIPLTKITGLKEILRRGQGHNLNMRAAAMQYARQSGKPFDSLDMIVVHLGGGISVSVISRGKIIDMISDNEGPFAPERSGGLPCDQLIDLMAREGLDRAKMAKKLKRSGGLVSHFGTSDCRKVEQMAENGDERAALVYEAMALNVAKSVAGMAATVFGRVDGIVLTGGIAHSARLTRMIRERTEFIAPVAILPGENEMCALALGILRVRRGEEEARIFTEPTP